MYKELGPKRGKELAFHLPNVYMMTSVREWISFILYHKMQYTQGKFRIDFKGYGWQHLDIDMIMGHKGVTLILVKFVSYHNQTSKLYQA